MNIQDIDAVYVLTCTQKIGRLPMVKSEVERIGLGDKLHVVTQFPNPFDALIREQVPHIRELNHSSRMNLWLGHYRMLKTGYELGFNNVLFLEDDARFLKDVNRIQEALAELPLDYGAALWDCACKSSFHYKNGLANGKNLHLTKWGCTAGGVPLTSTGAYMLNRRGMREFIGLFESVTVRTCSFRMARCTDHYWKPLARKLGKRLFFAAPNLSIQADLRAEPTLKGIYLGGYRFPKSTMGILLEDYTEDFPVATCEKDTKVPEVTPGSASNIISGWANTLAKFPELNTCKNIIVLANHNQLNYTPDQLNNTLEKYHPEDSCLVLLNHAGPWKNISADLRKRFRTILWVRRYHATNNVYQGQDGTVTGDNVIPVYLHGDGRIPKENIVVEVPGSCDAIKDAKEQLKTCGVKGNPTCGMLVGSFLRNTFQSANIVLQGFDDNDIDRSIYKTSWHSPLEGEHKILKDHYKCELTPIVSACS